MLSSAIDDAFIYSGNLQCSIDGAISGLRKGFDQVINHLPSASRDEADTSTQCGLLSASRIL